MVALLKENKNAMQQRRGIKCPVSDLLNEVIRIMK